MFVPYHSKKTVYLYATTQSHTQFVKICTKAISAYFVRFCAFCATSFTGKYFWGGQTSESY
jgi:hypothetical protein